MVIFLKGLFKPNKVSLFIFEKIQALVCMCVFSSRCLCRHNILIMNFVLITIKFPLGEYSFLQPGHTSRRQTCSAIKQQDA